MPGLSQEATVWQDEAPAPVKPERRKDSVTPLRGNEHNEQTTEKATPTTVRPRGGLSWKERRDLIALSTSTPERQPVHLCEEAAEQQAEPMPARPIGGIPWRDVSKQKPETAADRLARLIQEIKGTPDPVPERPWGNRAAKAQSSPTSRPAPLPKAAGQGRQPQVVTPISKAAANTSRMAGKAASNTVRATGKVAGGVVRLTGGAVKALDSFLDLFSGGTPKAKRNDKGEHTTASRGDTASLVQTQSMVAKPEEPKPEKTYSPDDLREATIDRINDIKAKADPRLDALIREHEDKEALRRWNSRDDGLGR